MDIPDKVREAVRERWNISADFDGQVRMTELQHEWIVWRAADGDKAGGLRLVVPKRAGNAFEIPSGYAADDEHGVSWEYEITIEACETANFESASILEKHSAYFSSRPLSN